MKALLSIFAHPDDEAFGPGGFIALEAKRRDVHLVCVTDGAAGKNSLDSKNSHSTKEELAKIRKRELLKSFRILGVKTVHFLEYEDGSLNNSVYHEIARKIQPVIDDIRPESLLTFEPRGVSGHIDHITVSMISSYLFRENKIIQSLYFYAVPDSRQEFERRDNYFIYFPKGYQDHEIHKTVNTESVWNIKKKAMLAHASQAHDSSAILGRIEKLPKEEHFIIESR